MKKGLIESVEQDSDSSFYNTFQLVIPGFHNAYSHAFQRAMAGWCEKNKYSKIVFGLGELKCIIWQGK